MFDPLTESLMPPRALFDQPMKRWNAVYGAMVALQVQKRMDEGRGPPDLEAWGRIIEEAEAVADCEAGAVRLLEKGEKL